MPLEIDMYLDNFIDNYDNKEELVGVIRNILLGKNVKGLEDYSKYVLSLSMEKKIMKCMEILHLNTNGKSMWNEVKSHAPNLFFESENIDKFIKMYLKHKGRKTVSEIETIFSQFWNALSAISETSLSLIIGGIMTFFVSLVNPDIVSDPTGVSEIKKLLLVIPIERNS